MPMDVSRRSFIKLTGQLSGLCLTVTSFPQLFAQSPIPRRGKIMHPLAPDKSWMDGSGKAKHRFEGVAKVTGQKVFGVDFRSKDIPGWPQQESRAVIIGAHVVDQIFVGFDFAKLEKA